MPRARWRCDPPMPPRIAPISALAISTAPGTVHTLSDGVSQGWKKAGNSTFWLCFCGRRRPTCGDKKCVKRWDRKPYPGPPGPISRGAKSLSWKSSLPFQVPYLRESGQGSVSIIWVASAVERAVEESSVHWSANTNLSCSATPRALFRCRRRDR